MKTIKVHFWDQLPYNFIGIVEHVNGDKWHFDLGRPHRTNGPAVEYANGSKIWHIKGIIHRITGPAVEYADGYKAWYINGKQVTGLEYNLLCDLMRLKGLLW